MKVDPKKGFKQFRPEEDMPYSIDADLFAKSINAIPAGINIAVDPGTIAGNETALRIMKTLVHEENEKAEARERLRFEMRLKLLDIESIIREQNLDGRELLILQKQLVEIQLMIMELERPLTKRETTYMLNELARIDIKLVVEDSKDKMSNVFLSLIESMKRLTGAKERT